MVVEKTSYHPRLYDMAEARPWTGGQGVMKPRRGAVIAALCATAVLSVCGARLAGFGLPAMKNISRPPAEAPSTSVSAEPFASAQVTAVRVDAASNSDVAPNPAPIEPASVLA